MQATVSSLKAWNADGDEVTPPTLQTIQRGSEKKRWSATDVDDSGGDMENFNYWRIGEGRKDGEKPPVIISKKVDMNLLNITLEVKGNETKDTP